MIAGNIRSTNGIDEGALRIHYYDRQTKTMMEEPIYAQGFLNWSYNTRVGRFATDLLFRQKIVSRLYGWLHRQPWSRRRIKSFAEAMRVNLQECGRLLEDFSSFNDFFTREIDLSARPVNSDKRVCIAPADGKILAFPTVDREKTFRIKRSAFNLQKFLGSEALTKRYTGGSMVIVRLHLSDYHHFHFPDSGIPAEALPIPGKLYTVSPYSYQKLVPFYTENYRMITLLASDHFGQMAMVEIGAFTVGSIKQRYRPGVRVAKGTKKGFFELGGSTVVLLFQEGAIRLDEDLCAKTEEKIETYVRMGESIGTI
jgi:phosphatidylserine decarboxylase